MSVTVKIKNLRSDKGLTQRQIADAMGITETNYRKLENNNVKSISYETLEFLCKYFNCTPNDIFEVNIQK
jgi:DNA-binding Xre family transcriptional regulator